MKISKIDNYVHVLDTLINPWTILREIADSNERRDAFYICDVGEIIRKVETWKTALPRVEPYYAVKCNDSLTVLELLAALGTGFNVASKSEIERILSIRAPFERIILTNPLKPTSLLKNAANSGLSYLTFDSVQELQKIKKNHPNANLVISVRIDEDDDYSEIKFGCDSFLEAPELLKTAHSLDLNVVGVSFQSSDSKTPKSYAKFIEIAKNLFEYASSLSFNFSLLDLGGGFPARSEHFDEIVEVINQALDEYFPETSLKIIAEPSRFLVSSAFTLACNIHSVRVVDKIDPISGDYHTHRMYFINDGVYGSFNFILQDQQEIVDPQPLKNDQMANLYSSSIWGPTCDGLDQIVEEVVLQEMNVGDWIIFEDMGAYTLPSSSNEFPVAKMHVLADENTLNFLNENLRLSEDHFVMGSAGIRSSLKGKNLKKENQNNNTVTFPSIIPRHELTGTITFNEDNIFHSINFQWE